MKKIYIVAFKGKRRNEVVAFDDEASRSSFINDLRDNNYSFCTTTAMVKY